MNQKQFVDSIDDPQLVQAIKRAEQKTSAEFRVAVAPDAVDDPVRAAREQFAKLKMDRTTHRNAVLIFVAPQSRNFALFGDIAAVEKTPKEMWTALATELSAHFAKNEYTAGLVLALDQLSAALSEAFPLDAQHRNELPDAVDRDKDKP